MKLHIKFKKKYFFIPTGVLVGLFLIGYGLLTFVNLRTFQFFGGLFYHIDTDRKVVALTFDDAPTPYVKDVLDTLSNKNVKATFFEIGMNIEKNPDVARAIVDAGMEIGNHSYSHTRMVFKSMAFYQEEVEKTNNLIRASGYEGPIYFRPPNGKKLIGLPYYLNQHNIKTIMWDVEPDTYKDDGSSSENMADPQFVIDYTLQNTRPGSIILLHPFCGEECESDRKALPAIIDGLQLKGYTFLTVSELLALDGLK